MLSVSNSPISNPPSPIQNSLILSLDGANIRAITTSSSAEIETNKHLKSTDSPNGFDMVDAKVFNPTANTSGAESKVVHSVIPSAPAAPSAPVIPSAPAIDENFHTASSFMGFPPQDNNHNQSNRSQSPTDFISNVHRESNLEEKAVPDDDPGRDRDEEGSNNSTSKNKIDWSSDMLSQYSSAINFIEKSSSEGSVYMLESDDELGALDESSDSSLYAVSGKESSYGYSCSDDSSPKADNISQKKNKDTVDASSNSAPKKHKQKKKHIQKSPASSNENLLNSNQGSSSDESTSLKFHTNKTKENAKQRKINSNKRKKLKASSSTKKTLNKSSKEKIKYSKLNESSSEGSDHTGSEKDSEEKKGYSWKQAGGVFFAGLTIGMGGVVAVMRDGGAGALAVGGFIGISVSLSSESDVEGDNNIVVSSGSSSFFSYNYIWKPPNVELIDSLNEKNQMECLKLGMVFKDTSDGAWYGWDTQRNGPACLMEIPKSMVKGFCSSLLIPQDSQKTTNKKKPKITKRSTLNFLNLVRGKDVNNADKKQGLKWLKNGKP